MGNVSIFILDFITEEEDKLCFIRWCFFDFVIVFLVLNSRDVFIELRNNLF